MEWKNVDLGSGTIGVEQQTGRVYGEQGVRLLPLKTKTSRRLICLPAFACQILRCHEDVQRLERRRAQEEGIWKEHGVVFCGPTGKLYFRSQPLDAFRRITKRLRVEGATLRTFRHTVATHMAENGVPSKATQALLGHASDRMTNSVYTHVTSVGAAAATEAM